MQILKGCQYVPIFTWYYHQYSCIHVVLSMTYQWQWGVDQSTDRWCASWRRRNSSDVSSAVIAWRLGQPTSGTKASWWGCNQLRCLMFVKIMISPGCVNTHSKQKKLVWTTKTINSLGFRLCFVHLGHVFSVAKTAETSETKCVCISAASCLPEHRLPTAAVAAHKFMWTMST